LKQRRECKTFIKKRILANGIIIAHRQVVALQVPESIVEELIRGKAR